MQLTVEAIEKMTPPMLRRAVKEFGQDPMSPEFGQGDKEKMKVWLLAKVAKPKAAPKPPVAAAPPKAAPVAEQQVVPKDVSPAARAWMEEMSLRVATLEQQVGIAHGTVTKAPEAPDHRELLKEFLQLDEETGAQEYHLEVSQVPTLNLAQKKAVLSEMGYSSANMPPDSAPREMDRLIIEQLKKLISDVDPPAPKGKPVTPDAAATMASKWKVGQIVKTLYDGDEYDPCQVEKVSRRKDGSFEYSVYFAADGSVVPDLTDEDITGLSKKKMPPRDE